MAAIRFEKVNKIFDDGTKAVSDLDLSINDGEFLVLVGPSGCGKTTALRMIAGLEEISEGELLIGDEVVNEASVKERDIAMVFQNYALYPHMSVYDNMAFGLKMRKFSKVEIDERVRDAARILDLDKYLKRKPRALSGGQRQRVAMGRAIVRHPQAFLMDEPLSNLDAKLRIQMRAEISRIQRELAVTTVYVTHDQVEAMTMGDRVAVMRFGELQQVDTPQALYERPANLFVAGFIGSPAMNLVEATIARDGDRYMAQVAEHRLALAPELIARIPAIASSVGKVIALGIRPEDMEDARLVPEAAKDQCINVKVSLVETLGSDIVVHFPVAATQVQFKTAAEREKDEEIEELGAGSGSMVFVARVSPRSTTRVGDEVPLFVDTKRAHAFDPETGQSLTARFGTPATAEAVPA